MKKGIDTRHGFGLIRHYGWKKDLLAVAAGFLCCRGLGILSQLLAGVRGISMLDPSIAVIPYLGFFLGIWGIIGCLLEYVYSIVRAILMNPDTEYMLSIWYIILSLLTMVIYSTLPSVLWYAFPLKGEERASFPRLDTSGHVIKYYVISIITLALYIFFSLFGTSLSTLQSIALEIVSWFVQYLDVVLIVGMPLLILVSVIRNRTITINERMVLAFLIIGVVASTLGGYLLYRNTLQLEPQIFEDYERAFSESTFDWSEESQEIYSRYERFWNWFFIMMGIMLNVLLAVEILFMRSIEKKVTRPILHLSDVLTDYSDQEEVGFDPEEVKEQCKPYRYGYGEISNLTRTCVNMVGEIDTYTKNLQTVTAEKERIGAELDIASKIQSDMLPGIFPPFPDRKEIDLYASMTPAKEVGGDFYDFYFVDHDHLALTIADVSGKGVPAALFMVISKTLLKNHALSGCSPKEVLTYVNHQLCQNNTSMMFCTVWFGILDVTNGKLTAANAGHEYPAIMNADGQFELMKDRHDPPLGLRDGLRYHEYDMTLTPGEYFFEYTDGVTEATDASLELFGDDRLIESLNQKKDIGPEGLINNLYDSIHGFVKEAPQFDDITMLCFKYQGSQDNSGGRQAHLSVPARDDCLDEVMEFTEEHLRGVDCSEDNIFTITLSVEEIFVNIAHYAYDGGEGMAEITFSYNESDRMVEMVFSDSGIPFDPTSRPSPDLTSDPGERPIGGLGIHIVKKTMDEVEYNYLGGKNSLMIRKRI